MRSCHTLRLSDVLKDLWVLLPGLRSPPSLLLPSFPKVFLLSTSTFRSWYLVIFSTSFWSILLSPGVAKSINHTNFFSTTVIFGMLWARCFSDKILKSQRILISSFYITFSTLCFYHFRMQVDGISCTDSNVAWKLLYNDTLYNICAIVLHELIKWSILLLHNRHLLSSVTLSILALMALESRAWSWAAIKKPSVSYFSSPFFS